MEQQPMRLQKFMALCGIASRRKCEEIITEGKVQVNDQMIDTLGIKINPSKDVVKVNGKIIKRKKNNIYIMLNKPVGYVSTVDDQFDRRTVMEIISGDITARLYPVGRLDYNTEGLLLMTNDGDFTYTITHPKNHVNKTYIATVKGIPTIATIKKLRKGVQIEDYITSPAKVKVIKIMNASIQLSITIYEGKNRQVRKMCEAVGHPVIALKRIAIGDVQLGNLPLRKWRHLNQHEINKLMTKDK